MRLFIYLFLCFKGITYVSNSPLHYLNFFCKGITGTTNLPAFLRSIILSYFFSALERFCRAAAFPILQVSHGGTLVSYQNGKSSSIGIFSKSGCEGKGGCSDVVEEKSLLLFAFCTRSPVNDTVSATISVT